jgi:hypothetical protein
MKDKIAMAIAWRLPRRLIYWVIVRTGANHRDGLPADFPGDRRVEELAKEWQA